MDLQDAGRIIYIWCVYIVIYIQVHYYYCVRIRELTIKGYTLVCFRPSNQERMWMKPFADSWRKPQDCCPCYTEANSVTLIPSGWSGELNANNPNLWHNWKKISWQKWASMGVMSSSGCFLSPLKDWWLGEGPWWLKKGKTKGNYRSVSLISISGKVRANPPGRYFQLHKG